MKTLASLGLLVVLGSAGAQAQIFRPEAVNGAALGAIAGAIIGNNSGSLDHNAWRGAAWGAGIGLVAGQVLGDANDRGEWRGPPLPAHAPQRPPFRGGPAHGFDRRPFDRRDGLVWGAITGAVVGNNSRVFRHNSWRGAAWGAGVGYILGAIAEDGARHRPLPRSVRVAPPPAPVVTAPAQQITIINNYYNAPATGMAPANQLFVRN